MARIISRGIEGVDGVSSTIRTVKSEYADDAVIVHQNYGNTHSKWKNRLEADSHNVTSGTSLPSSVSSYEILVRKKKAA